MLGHPYDARQTPERAYEPVSSDTSAEVDLDRVWSGVAGEIWSRPIGPLERGAGRLFGSPGLARALVTTPSLVLSWILASIVVLAFGVLFTRASGTPWVALLAPALAGVGIAYAYGPGVDPAFELSQTMAVSPRLILFTRGFAVFGLNALLGLFASIVAQQSLSLTMGWLLPMTTICGLALAVTNLTRSPNAGVAAALTGWAIVVLAAASSTQDLTRAVTANGLMPIYLTCTIVLFALALYGTSARRGRSMQWR
jgi:hypothetical protein